MLPTLPSDPIMLMSVINTRLRDNYDSLDSLCDDLQIDRSQLESTLADAGFTYMPDINQFR